MFFDGVSLRVSFLLFIGLFLLSRFDVGRCSPEGYTGKTMLETAIGLLGGVGKIKQGLVLCIENPSDLHRLKKDAF